MINYDLDITNILVVSPQIRYIKAFDIMNPPFNEQIWPVPSDFVKSRFHCIHNLHLHFWSSILSLLEYFDCGLWSCIIVVFLHSYLDLDSKLIQRISKEFHFLELFYWYDSFDRAKPMQFHLKWRMQPSVSVECSWSFVCLPHWCEAFIWWENMRTK